MRVLKPYREFEEKLQQFSLAVEEFLALPIHQQLLEDLAYFQQSLGFRDEDVAHLVSDLLKTSLSLPVKSLDIPKEDLKQDTKSKLNTEDYFTQGHEKANRQDYKGAIEDYTRAIDLKPDYTYHRRGVARYTLGDLQGAIEDYAKAYHSRGLAYHNKCDYKGAVKEYTEAIRVKPDYADAYYNRAVSRTELKANDKAIANYRKAVNLYPAYNSFQQKALDKIKELQ